MEFIAFFRCVFFLRISLVYVVVKGMGLASYLLRIFENYPGLYSVRES